MKPSDLCLCYTLCCSLCHHIFSRFRLVRSGGLHNLSSIRFRSIRPLSNAVGFMPPPKDQDACKAVAREKRLTIQRGQSSGDYRLSTFLPENLIQKTLLLPPRSPTEPAAVRELLRLYARDYTLARKKCPSRMACLPPGGATNRLREPPITKIQQKSTTGCQVFLSIPFRVLGPPGGPDGLQMTESSAQPDIPTVIAQPTLCHCLRES